MPQLWLRKMITMIDAWDLDKDGYVGYDDVMNIAYKFIQVGKFDGNSADNVIEFYRGGLKHSSDNPFEEIVQSTSMSDQLVAIWRTKDNPSALKLICKLYSDMFKALDRNATGFLTFDQYLVFWNTFNLDKRFAKLQFDNMDTDLDGKISEEEFVNAYLDYRKKEDDKLNRFFGPLLKY
ncbi:unnamed protein product [Owenia fusiformis]|uniref:EF-hand domain-containing protein n=1 Tax=Owenia fusiformis TaxID=6347 RepID=A0A8S4P4P2_OWEFU|nr:unnamed protein product [Owenia fusiformis]